MIRKFNTCERFETLREIVNYADQQYGQRIAFKDLLDDRTVAEYSFQRLKNDTQDIALKLIADGFKGKHFALIGDSSYQYVACYLAIVNWVGVIIPIDKELNDTDIVKLIDKCDAEVIFYSDVLAEDILEIMSRCLKVKIAIHIGSIDHQHLHLTLEDVVTAGRLLSIEQKRAMLSSNLDPDALCTILFTSGTTGANKGVMLCHRNLASTVFAALSMFKMPETSFSVLPINHSYEFNIHVLSCICGGATLCFNDSIKHVKQNLMTYKPQMSLMVPMIVDGLYKNIWKESEKAGLVNHLKFGIWFSNLIRKVGIDKRSLFFFPILDALGGKLNVIVCGGAPLNPALIKGFDNIGIKVYNGYGITECSPLISTNGPLADRPGSVGQVVPICTVEIGARRPDGQGEIWVKGDNVMLGYYHDEEATRNSFTADGWFRTGDIGYLDKKGFLYITGREKNLIILANGKNVHPEELEEKIVNSIPYIREVLVYAPKDLVGQDCAITAEAFLDQEYIELHGLADVYRNFDEDMRKLNGHLSAYKRIEHYSIRKTEFDKTTTKKIKRNFTK
ncbi:MAG: AMP-binding protein [Eubacteriales bacterium]|nr:AMP-binding protein [Eubacteriales bacterium]